MASNFATGADGGNEVAITAGNDASLHAVADGPWSNSLAFQYCNDMLAYCDVDDCKLQLRCLVEGAQSLGHRIRWMLTISSHRSLGFHRLANSLHTWLGLGFCTSS